MTDAHEIVQSLLRTEKSVLHQPHGKYFFSVRRDANKIQIRQAVEEIYKVKVKGVNTEQMRGKLKRVRAKLGKTADWKKAIVTLQDGHKIDLT
jgi:large subunit ribosomal protein L23